MKTSKAVKRLDELANHFMPRDWNYTRISHIKEIRYENAQDPRNKVSQRIKSAAFWMFGKTPDWLAILDGPRNGIIKRFRMAMFALKRDPNTPDGVLDSGNVITFWEETGEYLNFMQPTVGALLVNFLKEEPEHPHAKLITAELNRLERLYAKRWKNGEVTGD